MDGAVISDQCYDLSSADNAIASFKKWSYAVEKLAEWETGFRCRWVSPNHENKCFQLIFANSTKISYLEQIQRVLHTKHTVGYETCLNHCNTSQGKILSHHCFAGATWGGGDASVSSCDACLESIFPPPCLPRILFSTPAFNFGQDAVVDRSGGNIYHSRQQPSQEVLGDNQ